MARGMKRLWRGRFWKNGTMNRIKTTLTEATVKEPPRTEILDAKLGSIKMKRGIVIFAKLMHR
jgi:hypothetical protein